MEWTPLRLKLLQRRLDAGEGRMVGGHHQPFKAGWFLVRQKAWDGSYNYLLYNFPETLSPFKEWDEAVRALRKLKLI